MEIAADRGAEEDDGFNIRSGCVANALYKVVEFIFRNHSRPQFLPTAAGPAAAGASTAKATKSAASATTTTAESAEPSAAKSSATTVAEHTGKQNPEQNAAERRGEDDQNNNNQQDDAAEGDAVILGLAVRLRGSERLCVGELNSSVGGDDIGDAREIGRASCRERV
jgi:hypothetical protein